MHRVGSSLRDVLGRHTPDSARSGGSHNDHQPGTLLPHAVHHYRRRLAAAVALAVPFACPTIPIAPRPWQPGSRDGLIRTRPMVCTKCRCRRWSPPSSTKHAHSKGLLRQLSERLQGALGSSRSTHSAAATPPGSPAPKPRAVEKCGACGHHFIDHDCTIAASVDRELQVGLTGTADAWRLPALAPASCARIAHALGTLESSGATSALGSRLYTLVGGASPSLPPASASTMPEGSRLHCHVQEWLLHTAHKAQHHMLEAVHEGRESDVPPLPLPAAAALELLLHVSPYWDHATPTSDNDDSRPSSSSMQPLDPVSAPVIADVALYFQTGSLAAPRQRSAAHAASRAAALAPHHVVIGSGDGACCVAAQAVALGVMACLANNAPLVPYEAYDSVTAAIGAQGMRI